MEHNASVLGRRLYALDRDTLAALGQSLCAQLTERGAYHGGIRPENLLCAEDGRVTLGEPANRDATGDWTSAELEYMAPEVFWNGTRTLAADVYSIGMLLYAGVNAGQMPFCAAEASAADSAEALRRRMNGEALEMPKTAGKHLARIIEKATQFRADDRYESPAALGAALGDYRDTLRTNIPAAREMFEKPQQELTEVERMLLAILTEKAAREEAEKAAAEEAERLAAEEAAAEEAARLAAEEAEKAAEQTPEPTDDAPAQEAAAQPAAEETPASEAPADAPAEEKQEASAVQKAGRKAGIDPALVEAISASVAARMSEPEEEAKPSPAEERSEAHKAEEARISQQLEQMDWIGHNDDDDRRSRSGWIVAGLCLVAVVLGALIFHSIGSLGRQQREILAAESPAVTDTVLASAAPTDSAAPVESDAPTAAPTDSPAPTATPTPTPAPEHRYELVLSNASWETAKQEAEAKGGYLAVIESGEELQKIASMAAEKGAQYVWIGLSRDANGELQWVKKTDSGYISWAAGEPSVRDSYTGNPENYVLLANKGGTWLYNDCIGDPAGSYPRFYSGVLAYVIEYDQ